MFYSSFTLYFDRDVFPSMDIFASVGVPSQVVFLHVYIVCFFEHDWQFLRRFSILYNIREWCFASFLCSSLWASGLLCYLVHQLVRLRYPQLVSIGPFPFMRFTRYDVLANDPIHFLHYLFFPYCPNNN